MPGTHEVVIETAERRHHLADLSVTEVIRILLAWQKRVRQLEGRPMSRYVTVFRNEGFSAGASLPHVHSQILATSVMPPQLRQRQQASSEYRQQTGRSLWHDLIQQEFSDGERVVCHDGPCLVWCPFAGRVAWQTRLACSPAHTGRFADVSEEIITWLAVRLLGCVQGIRDCSQIPAFNLVLVQMPVDGGEHDWFVDILPRPARVAGYELATDVDVVTVAPEFVAAQLRESCRWSSDDAGSVCPDGYEWRETAFAVSDA